MDTIKPFVISKQSVWEAWKSVKRNGGGPGIDGQTIELYEQDLKGNLYKLWNRMSSGTYFPPPVRGVEIPKKTGGHRLLGVPAVSDRVGQTIAKMVLEPILEKVFLKDSYGYRPHKSAHDAVESTQKRCWRYDFLVEFDIRGMFDNISHSLLLKALKHHTDNKWVLLYVERWLKSPTIIGDGSIIPREKGVSQGGSISPLLCNLFLHYVFDKWMERNFPNNPWCRYCDDGLLHCNSYQQARMILKKLTDRFKDCGLEIHPEKTNIIYCKDSNRQRRCNNINEFTFLGFTFKRRSCRNKVNGKLFDSFKPAVSRVACKAMKLTIREKWRLKSKIHLSLDDLAMYLNPIIRGWFTYYGRFCKREMEMIARYINFVLRRWAGRKFLKLRGRTTRACNWLKKVFECRPNLFAHWKLFKVH